jgi:uncharacterized membrane protein YqjE
MNDQSGPGARAGSLLSLFASMAETRLKLAAFELEVQVRAAVASTLLGFMAVVMALVALTFIGIVIIALFWETHRIAAAVLTAGGYIGLSALLFIKAVSTWTARPAPFADTRRELEQDCAMFRGDET